jgi:hypothetical protein
MKAKKGYEHLTISYTDHNGVKQVVILGQMTSREIENLALYGIDVSKYIETEKPKKYKNKRNGGGTIQDSMDEQDNGDA